MTTKNTTEKAKRTTTARKQNTKVEKATHEDVANQIGTQRATNNLPVLRDISGGEIALTVSNINSMGSQAGQNMSKLSDAVLARVKVCDSGELGDGIGKILAHTRSVDITRLGTKDSSLISRVWNIFSDQKQKVLDQFNTSADQINQITDTLKDGLQRMRGETVWLAETYKANIDYLRELEDILDNVLDVKEVQDQLLEAVLAKEETDIEELENQRSICSALDKQADKLRRLIQLAKLTAPQIGSMRAVNQNTIDKFESLETIVIPAWKNNMSLGLISLQQAKDNELSEAIDNETNRIFVENSKRVGVNMRESAKAAQRGIISIESLKEIHNNTISAIKDTNQIELKGAEEIKKAEVALVQMDQELKSALREIAEQRGKV